MGSSVSKNITGDTEKSNSGNETDNYLEQPKSVKNETTQQTSAEENKSNIDADANVLPHIMKEISAAAKRIERKHTEEKQSAAEATASDGDEQKDPGVQPTFTEEPKSVDSEPQTTVASTTGEAEAGAGAASDIDEESSPIPGPGSVERKRRLSLRDPPWQQIVDKIDSGSDFLSV